MLLAVQPVALLAVQPVAGLERLMAEEQLVPHSLELAEVVQYCSQPHLAVQPVVEPAFAAAVLMVVECAAAALMPNLLMNKDHLLPDGPGGSMLLVVFQRLQRFCDASKSSSFRNVR